MNILHWLNTDYVIHFVLAKGAKQNTDQMRPNENLFAIELLYIWTPGHSGSLLIRSFSLPVLPVLGAFLPNLVFKNFPGKSETRALHHCPSSSNSKLAFAFLTKCSAF